MNIQVIKIGNSKGIILSKTLLEKYQIKDELEVTLGEGEFTLKPKRKPREGWAEASKKIAAAGEDKLMMPDVFEDENLEEWN